MIAGIAAVLGAGMVVALVRLGADRPGDLHERYRADPAAELPELSQAGLHCADVAAHV